MVGYNALDSRSQRAQRRTSPILTAPHADSRSFTFLPDGRLVETDDNGMYVLSNPMELAASRASGNRRMA